MMLEMEDVSLLEEEQSEIQERRLVLVGKTGSGKSSLANTIFGKEFKQGGQFKTSSSSVSMTMKCESGTKEINGKLVKLIDTPGYFDTKQARKEVTSENMESLKEAAPGPHAFLMVLKVERYTTQEEDVVEEMLKCFSEEALKYTTVVFTHGDQLEGEKIIDWANKNDALKTLIQKCGGRVHVFDNKYWNNSQDPYRNNQYQVKELLKTIDQTVEENGGKCYTNGLWQQIKNMLLRATPLHILLGFILGGVVFGAAGAGIAAAAGATALGVCLAGMGAGLAGGGLGTVGPTVVLKRAGRVASGTVSAVQSGVEALDSGGCKFKML